MSLGRIILIVYLAILVLLVIVFSQISRHKKRFEVLFTYDVDYIFFEISKQIIDAKDSLYDYENTLSLLYHDKKRIFTKPSITYEQQFPKIKENMDYLEKLLQKKIFTDSFRKRLYANYTTLAKISKILNAIYTMLIFRTLGIAKLWNI